MSSDAESNEDTLESFEGADYETPLSTPRSTPPLADSITHDTSRTKYHMKDLESFATSLENSAKRAFPNRGRSTARYKNVEVLLLRWAEDDLGVAWEVEDLEKTFKSYGFNAETWLIPSENSHLKLMLKAGTFVETRESTDTLFIVYYGGHATINRRRQSTWSCKRDLTYATLEWSAIQIVFEKAKSDVLLLLDCCSAASAAPIAGRAITETIAACGWESIAAEPGRFSFTDTLIKVLQEWINRPFTAAMLHCEMLSRLKHENPELMGNQRVEIRRTPIYIVTTGDLGACSIYLAKMKDASEIGDLEEPPLSTPKEEAASGDIEDIDKITGTSVDGTLKTPHVLISLALEENQILDSGACSRWLASFPALAKYAKVESVFKSHSTLLLVSLPVVIWDLLPEDPACSFIGYVCSENLLGAPAIKEETGIVNVASAMDTRLDLAQKSTSQLPLADINLQVAILEEMVAACLNEDFKDELSAIEQGFRVLSEGERTAALYALFQHATGAQIEFLTLVLQQMGKNSASSTVQSATSPTRTSGARRSALDPSTIKAMFPDAVAAIEAEKFKLTEQCVPRREGSSSNAHSLCRGRRDKSPDYVANLEHEIAARNAKIEELRAEILIRKRPERDEEGPEKSRQDLGIKITQKPVKMAPNSLPLLIVPESTYKRGMSHDLSPFHSSVAGSIYSNTSSEGPRNNLLWAPSRSTSISTMTDRSTSTPISTSHWSPVGVVNTPQDYRSPSFESMFEYRDEPLSSPHTATPKMTQQPIDASSTAEAVHQPHFAADFGSSLQKPNRQLGSSRKEKGLMPSNTTSFGGKTELLPIPPRREDDRRFIHISSPHAIGWTVKVKLDPGTDENWISSRVVKELKLPVQSATTAKSIQLGAIYRFSETTVQARWCDPSKTPSCQYDSMFYVAPMHGPFEVIFGRKLTSAFGDDQTQMASGYDKGAGDEGHQSVRDSGFEEKTSDCDYA